MHELAVQGSAHRPPGPVFIPLPGSLATASTATPSTATPATAYEAISRPADVVERQPHFELVFVIDFGAEHGAKTKIQETDFVPGLAVNPIADTQAATTYRFIGTALPGSYACPASPAIS